MKILYSFFFIATFFTVFEMNTVLAKTNYHSVFNLQINQQKLQNDDIQELINQANELYKQKKYAEALEVLKKAVDKAPNDFRPRAMTGLVYLVQFKVKEASEEFSKAIKLNPNNKFLYLYKARADYFRNAREESLAASLKAIELDSSFIDAHLLVGDILRYMKGRENEAIESYKKVIDLNPKVLSAYINLASTLESQKKDKEAEEFYKKAISLDKNKMAGRFDLGRLLVDQGRLKEARKLWEERTSDKDNTFPNFITVLKRAENLKKAKEEFAKTPNNPKTLLQMGYAIMDGDHWVVNGRQEEALIHFKKALKIKPDFAEAQKAIVKAYVEIADMDKRENVTLDKELEKLRKLNSNFAKEMEEYRKTYSGGIKTGGPPPPAPPPPKKN